MTASMADPPVRPGQIIGGRYRVEEVIGAGTMGFVVSAWHLELDQRVALKVLNPDVFERTEALMRFRREVRAAARIKSEHVARVIDVGALESGDPYMVMELLRGNNLEEELHRRGVLPVTEAVAYVLEAVEALAEAHAAGFVHRDLKPANLFVARRADRSRLVKVLDFGISKSPTDSQASDMSLTKTGVIIGSPLYMSPEQMRSTKDADQRSDVWSLGAILFQLVTGRPPYQGETIPELCAQLFSEDAPPPSRLRQDIPAGLDAVLARALARDPNQRFQNVAELGEALAPFAPAARVHAERARRVLTGGDADHPNSVWPGPNDGAAPTIEAVAVVQPARTGSGPSSSRRKLWVVVAAAAVLGVVTFLFQTQRKERAEAVPAAKVAGATETPPAPVVPTAEPPTVVPSLMPAPALAETAAPVPSASVASAQPIARPTPAAVRTPRPPKAAPKPSPGSGVSDFGGRR